MKPESYYLGYIDALDRTRQLLDFLNRHGTFRYSSASAYLRREMVRINGEYREAIGRGVPVEVPASCDTPKHYPLGILDQGENQ